MSDKLWVLTSYFNPLGLKSRLKLYREFMLRMEATPGVEVVSVELNHTRFPATVPGLGAVSYYSPDMLFYKENLVNLAFRSLPPWVKYVAWLDADIAFCRPDWVEATIEALKWQHFVQLFSHVQDLTDKYQPIGEVLPGYVYAVGKYLAPPTPPGFAWAARRECLDRTNGICDELPVLGSSDDYMANALCKIDLGYPVPPEWIQWANKFGTVNIGYVPGLIVHYWHGRRENRGYQTRHALLAKYGHLLPDQLYRDVNGLWRWRDPENPYALAMKEWFEARKEDEVA